MTNVVSLAKPPAPYPGLTDDQCDLWRAIAGSMPAAWFKPCDLPLLREMVLALDQSRELADLIATTMGVDDLKKLLDLRDRECRRAAALARTLRLSPQSRYDRHAAGKAGRPQGGSRPWDAPEDTGEAYFASIEAE